MGQEPIDMNPPNAPETAEQGMASAQFPLVGIGASAGGLEALQRLLPGLPEEPGFAMVVILHLAPDQPSYVAEALQRHSKLPVIQVRQQPTEIEPNHIYVIAPGTLLKVEDRYLFIDQADGGRTALGAIDYFFHSMALSHRHLALGVLLSGMGHDGCAGMAALREQGGTTMAQQPDDAQFPPLPQAAVDTGQVDVVLPAGGMAQRLLVWGRVAASAPPVIQDGEAQALHDVLSIVHQRTGHDFRHYKRPTILRRLEHRLHLHGVRSLADYRAVLSQHDGNEAAQLMKDMLIGVTGFFRDRQAFERLREIVLPAMMEAREAGTLRAWTAACSTGQEAYSLAMLLSDVARNMPRPPEIHIFASDIDEQALGVARAGLYPPSIQDEVPPDSLERYFVLSGKQYRVRQSLRQLITFASHNLLRDPPFSGLDLVSCRNFMIYVDRAMQSHVLQRFHFALGGSGYLFLGNSETAGSLPELFQPIDRANRIYQAMPVRTRQVEHVESFAAMRQAVQRPARRAAASAGAAIALPVPASLHELRERLDAAETGCEELQSNNEELSTINAELKARLEDTSKANDDLNNLIASVDVATVFVNAALVVQRFTPRAASIFSLLPRDVGRNLLDITHSLDYPQMADDVAHTFDSLQPMEREVQGNDGRSYIVRVRPYRTGDDVIIGAVLTFFDISLRRSAEDEARERAVHQEFQLRLGDALRPLSDPLQVLEQGCRMLGEQLAVPRLAHAEIRGAGYAMLPGYASGLPPLRGEGALEALGPAPLACWRAGEVLVKNDIAQGGNASTQLPGLAALAGGSGALLASICRKGERWLGFFLACLPSARRWKPPEIALFDEASERIGVEYERARSQAALSSTERRLRGLLRELASACWETDGSGQVAGEAASWCALTGQAPGEAQGEGWLDAIHPDDREAVRDGWRAALREGVELDVKARVRRAEGGWRRASVMAGPQFDDQGAVQKWIACVIEIDGRVAPASGSI